jgi:hypothetical protein
VVRLTTPKLADGILTNPNIAYDAITTNKIKDGEVNTDDIVDSAVVGKLDIWIESIFWLCLDIFQSTSCLSDLDNIAIRVTHITANL